MEVIGGWAFMKSPPVCRGRFRGGKKKSLKHNSESSLVKMSKNRKICENFQTGNLNFITTSPVSLLTFMV